MKYIVIALLSFVLGYVMHDRLSPQRVNDVDASAVIEHSIEQVSKLVVTEGHYSQVFTRKNTASYMWDLIQFEKKAVIIGTVDVDVSYDLHGIQYQVDEDKKIITIKAIPRPELDYHYNFRWYDLDQSRMNQFTQDELNKIQEEAKTQVRSKVDVDFLTTEGHARLIDELGLMWSGLTSIGWKIMDESLATSRTVPSSKVNDVNSL